MSDARHRHLSGALVLAVGGLMLTPGSTMAATLNDPTRPPVVKQSVKKAPAEKPVRKRRPRWRLSAILIAADRRTAIIDEQWLAVGDRIHNARVIAIEAGSVRLKRRGRTIKLSLTDKDIKRPGRHGTDNRKAAPHD